MGICFMAQETQTGALYQPRGVGWRGRWEGASLRWSLWTKHPGLQCLSSTEKGRDWRGLLSPCGDSEDYSYRKERKLAAKLLPTLERQT